MNGGIYMTDIRDATGKLACRADAEKKTVEIVKGNSKTIIRFMPNGTVQSVSVITKKK